jgi:hypothetical protein
VIALPRPIDLAAYRIVQEEPDQRDPLSHTRADAVEGLFGQVRGHLLGGHQSGSFKIHCWRGRAIVV